MNSRTLESMTPAEFGKLFARYKQSFVSVAYGYLRNSMAAEDIVSDSFLSFWESRHRLEAQTNIPAYIMTSVKNKCLNRLKEQAAHSRIEQKLHRTQARIIEANIRSLEICNPERLFENEVCEIIDRELGEMPELTRYVFMDNRYLAKPYKEIARERGITSRRVEYELRKAIDILQAALKDYIPAIAIALLMSHI